MRIYLIRHADPDYERNTITPAGHLEAAALARRLAAHGLQRIYTSSLGRAQDTARYTADLLKLDPVTEDWLTEISDLRVTLTDGRNSSVWDVPGEVIRGGAALPGHDDWASPPHMGDSAVRRTVEAVWAAGDAFLARHGYAREGGRYRIVTSNREQIAVFCHNGLGLTWLAHLLALPLPLCWSAFWLAPSSVTTVLFDERSPQWAVPRCLNVGDTAHLYEARLPVQPRGIKGNFR